MAAEPANTEPLELPNETWQDYAHEAGISVCLWVQSYSWFDVYYVRQIGGRHLQLASSPGHITVAFSGGSNARSVTTSRLRSKPASEFEAILASHLHRTVSWKWRIANHFSASNKGLIAPHWAFAFAFMLLAFAPWARHLTPSLSARYSLRTLLVATTPIAVVLGLGVWLAS